MTVVYLLLAIILVIFLLTVIFGAPYVPSRKKDLKIGFDELYAVRSSDVVVDIGSGDGVVLRAAAEHGAKAVGYEINPILVLISRLISRRYQRVSIIQANFLHRQLPPDTTVVYVFAESYHIKQINAWLGQQVDRLGRPVHVISYGFELPGRKPLRELQAHRLYLLEPLQSPKPQVQ